MTTVREFVEKLEGSTILSVKPDHEDPESLDAEVSGSEINFEVTVKTKNRRRIQLHSIEGTDSEREIWGGGYCKLLKLKLSADQKN